MEHLGEKASGAPKVNPYAVIGGAGQQLRRPIPQRYNSADVKMVRGGNGYGLECIIKGRQGKSLSPAAGFWCAGALPSPPHGAKGRRKSTYSVSNFNASVSFHKEALALMTGSFLHCR
nr:hypothetical protein Iba_chr11dCG3290 [Ipomoea batatas]